jgi:hypothetical protein
LAARPAGRVTGVAIVRGAAMAAGCALFAVTAVSQPGDASSQPSIRPAQAYDTAPPDDWPGPSNTGVPAGTTLAPYDGPCTITTDGTVIDARIVNCTLEIKARGVVIRRSEVNGRVYSSEGSNASFMIFDSDVDAGPVTEAAVATMNLTVVRSDIRGAASTIYCYSNCFIIDSWLHGQYLADDSGTHLNGFLANDNGDDPGGRTNAWLIHNTIHCDTQPNALDGGCTGNVNLFGDFGAVSDVTVQDNLLRASTGMSYCVYGGESPDKPFPDSHNIVITGNVFERGSNGLCGDYGPVISFDSTDPGNHWSGNVWDDGTVVDPVN